MQQAVDERGRIVLEKLACFHKTIQEKIIYTREILKEATVRTSGSFRRLRSG